jgi:hypothetical protein
MMYTVSINQLTAIKFSPSPALVTANADCETSIFLAAPLPAAAPARLGGE